MVAVFSMNKSEARMSKNETISKFQIQRTQTSFEFCHFIFGFVSNFGLRISDLSLQLQLIIFVA
jgi:hypothetical protein